MKPLKYNCSSCGRKLQYRGYCSTCQVAYKQRQLLIGQLVLVGVSYMPSSDIPRDDYEDFVGSQWTAAQLESDLFAGVLPPGLILQCNGRTVVVHGRYDTHQWLMPYMQQVELCQP